MLMVMSGVLGFGRVGTVSAQEMSRVEVVDKVGGAVVTVLNMTSSGTDIFGQGSGELQPQGAGTGFIISKDGYIVTNWHVVDGGDSFVVVMQDGTQVEAELVGIDPRDDLAVVKIDPKNVKVVVEFGDSDALQAGQDVLAIGSPLGAFSNTVTAGIVSGLGRNQLDDPNQNVCQEYTNLIQHDAAINHGNSGGPLFDLNGKVVGVNTLGIPTDSQGQPVQGLFFAVPANTVKVAVEQMIKTGTITRPYLGISSYELDPTMQAQYDLPVPYGQLIDEVEGPAQEAGLQRNDIITGVDGKPADATTSISAMISRHNPGDVVTLNVLRDGKEIEVKVTLGEAEYDGSQCTMQGQ